MEILQKAYKLQGELDYHGLKIKIENRKGSVRHWKTDDGKEGTSKMYTRYGYIARTLGVDGDEVDVYVSDEDPTSEVVYVIHQNNPETGKFDEDKCMLGFKNAKSAKKAYLRQYDSKKFFGSMEAISLPRFKTRLSELRGKKLHKAEDLMPLQELIETLEKTAYPEASNNE